MTPLISPALSAKDAELLASEGGDMTISRPLTLLEEASALLEEVQYKGLVYWEPKTQRGYERKADMIARIEAFVDRAIAAAEGSR